METLESRTVTSELAVIVRDNRFTTNDKLKLFAAPLSNASGLVLADFTEAAFAGYAPFALSGSWTFSLDAAARWLVKYVGLAQFLQTGTGVVGTVYGWYITDTGGTILKAYAFFDSPAVMDAAGNQIVMTPFISGTMLGNADVEVLFGP